MCNYGVVVASSSAGGEVRKNPAPETTGEGEDWEEEEWEVSLCMCGFPLAASATKALQASCQVASMGYNMDFYRC